MPSVLHSCGVLHHRVGIVRRDDHQRRRAARHVRNDSSPALAIAPGVERRNLVVVAGRCCRRTTRENLPSTTFTSEVSMPAASSHAGSRRSPGPPSPSAAAARPAAPAYRRCSGAQPPRRLSIVSTRKLRLTRCMCSGRKCSVNLPGKRHQVVERDRAGDDELHAIEGSGLRLRAQGLRRPTASGRRFSCGASRPHLGQFSLRHFRYLPMIGARSACVGWDASGLVMIAVASALAHRHARRAARVDRVGDDLLRGLRRSASGCR